MSLNRIGDFKYFTYLEKEDKKLIIDTPESIILSSAFPEDFHHSFVSYELLPPFRYALAEKFANIIKNNPANSSFECTMGQAKWTATLQPKEKPSSLVKFFLGSFIHDQGNDGVMRLSIDHYPRIEEAFDPNFVKNDIQPINAETLDEASSLGSAPLIDPFTQLATWANQHLEPAFIAKDRFKPEDCQYALIKKDGCYLLVHKDAITVKMRNEVNDATKDYLQYLIYEYGMEKLKYVQYLYGFDLMDMISKGIPLSSEHVYRINIGMNNIEMEDLISLLQKLNELKVKLESVDPHQDLLPFLITLKGKFLGQELRGILRTLTKQFPDKSQDTALLLNWIQENFQNKTQPSHLSPSQFNELRKVLMTSVSRNRAYTGKEIFEQSQSAYTTAETTEYKPWIDQQELMRVFPIIKKQEDWELFYEKCVHTIVKCHLAKKHPTQQYRVGSLIPAPNNERGERRWYKVSSCINNGYGILSYTLESACNDPSLPVIKLYRSTASDSYAIDSKASVRNDINILNSPGYEGTGLASQYEEGFFQKRTIPIWVAYLEEAKQLIRSNDSENILKAFEQLRSAKRYLKETTLQPYKKQSLKGILRKHDGVLNDLYLKRGSLLSGIFNYDSIENKYYALYGTLVNRFVHQNEKVDQKNELELTDQLKTLLEELSQLNKDPKIVLGIQRVVSDLEKNLYLISNLDLVVSERKMRKMIYGHIEKLELEGADFFASNDLKGLHACLNIWSDAMDNYAKSIGEHIDQKQLQDVAIIGHSLGGASAQAQMCYSMVKKNRVIVPGKSCSLWIYDAPKINEEDNLSFKLFVDKHREIIKSQNISIALKFRQEAGDFVPMGGEQHLGATFSAKERDRLQSIINFEGILRERNPNAKEPTIAEAKTAHATQFAQGRHAGSKGQADAEEDYKHIYFDSFAQGVFDTGGNIPGKENETRQIYKDANDRFWKMPKLMRMDMMDSQTSEKIRRSSKLFLIRNSLSQSKQHPRDLHSRDINGVFAVTEEGMLSNRESL